MNRKKAGAVLDQLGLRFIMAANEPGMISGRIISMVINEAYFALGDEVSTKREIDTAMKLGTNYPLGPFEWGEEIGLQKIYMLLERLYKINSRYAIAPKLVEEIFNQTKIAINN